MSKREISTGKILVAEPFMEDPHFKRSVVLLCEHNELGSLGFILNKELESISMQELLADFPQFEDDLEGNYSSNVQFGGPVQTNTIHYIHDKGDILEESIPIGHGLFWGGNFDKLKFLISNKLIGQNHIRFYVGYAGWSEGQLAAEVEEGSWIVSDMDANYAFWSMRKQGDDLWAKALSNMGDLYSVIAQIPDPKLHRN